MRQALPITLALCVLTVAGCTKPQSRASGGSSGPRVVQIVAAENFWGSIATQLGGSHAHVTSIIANPATDPHDYEPTASDGRTVAGADLLIVNGAGYDAWASRLEQANGSSSTHVIDMGKLVHVAEGQNPHIWYSPDNVRVAIATITSELSRLDPRDAAYFANRRSMYEHGSLARYDSLVAQIKAKYAGTPVGISESIFVQMAQACGLRVVTPAGFYDSVAEGSDPTAADKETTDRQAMIGQIKVWVFNSQNATPDVQRITDEARGKGIPVVTVTETLSPATATFQDWQVDQLNRLAQALHTATGR